MYHFLGALVSRFWLWIIIAWVAVIFGINAVAPKWDDVTHDGDLAYLPDRMTTVRGEKLLRQAFPDSKSRSQMVVVLERAEAELTAEDLLVAENLAARFQPEQNVDPSIVSVWTPTTELVGKKLRSPDGHAALVVLSISNEFAATANMKLLKSVMAELDEAQASADFPAGLQLGITGSAAVGGDMLLSASESIQNIEHTTVIMVLLILLLVYRAPLLVLVPLVAIVVSVAVATDLVAILTQVHTIPGMEWFDFKIFKTTRIFVITILFGSGTDFCLFLISRYREELENGHDKASAITAAISNVGEALVGSACTVIFGLSMMFFADFGKFRNSGPAIGLCLLITLIACLTLAPALLRAFGGLVFWPFGLKIKSAEAVPAKAVPAKKSTIFNDFWGVTSHLIIRRPGLILVTSLALMAPFAYQGLDVPISYDLLNELQPDRTSPMGTAMLRRHFAAGDMGPITILVKQDDRNFNEREDRKQIKALTDQLYTMDEAIVAVRSVEQPLGDRAKADGKGRRRSGIRRIATKENPRTRDAYISQNGELAGKVTRFDVVLKHDPFSGEAARVLEGLDQKLTAMTEDPDSPWYQASMDFLGTTAGTRDLKAVTESDQVLIQRLVMLAVLGVIVFILKRPVVCLYLILSVLFSYYVTIGATEMVFDWLYPNFDGLDWKVPIFLFVILIAVGEDYNIYLVTRIIEEQKRHGMLEGVRVAAEKTGGIITSCGVIMAASFVSMTFGTLRGMLELGFALTLGVVLDTLIVRPILVPAFLALLYRNSDRRAPAAEAIAEDDTSGAHRPLSIASERPRRASSR